MSVERGLKALKESGYAPEDVPNLSDIELLKIPNVGRKTIRELREAFPVRRVVVMENREDMDVIEALVARLGGHMESL